MVIASSVIILTVKFGVRHRLPNRYHNNRSKFDFHRIWILALLIFSNLQSACFCKSAVLLDERYFFQNFSSTSLSGSPISRNRPANQESSATSSDILAMAAATFASGDDSDSLYVVRNNLGDTFFDMGEYGWGRKDIGKFSGAVDFWESKNELNIFYTVPLDF